MLRVPKIPPRSWRIISAVTGLTAIQKTLQAADTLCGLSSAETMLPEDPWRLAGGGSWSWGRRILSDAVTRGRSSTELPDNSQLTSRSWAMQERRQRPRGAGDPSRRGRSAFGRSARGGVGARMCQEKLSGKPGFYFLRGAGEITVAVQIPANTDCCGGAGRSGEGRDPALPPAPQGPRNRTKGPPGRSGTSEERVTANAAL